MMIFMPGICFARSRTSDSLLVNRMWDYYDHCKYDIEGVNKNLYMVYHFSTKRRNALLYLIPTMYSIARGDKDYVGESYSKLTYHNANDFHIQRQVICGTIPHNRNVMPMLFEMITPNLYGVQLYPNRILSPFHRSNRFFYKYRVTQKAGNVVIHFRPRSSNTQLIKGEVSIDPRTGRILTLNWEGEFDMIDFKIDAKMDRRNQNSLLPDQSTTEATFKFLGNNIKSTITTFYDCSTTLPDSIDNVEDPALMKKIRPIPLKKEERQIYAARQRQEQAEEQNDTTHKASNRLKEVKEVAWDIVGDNLINSMHTQTENISLNVSPLFNPLYMGYSQSKGISYKINIGGQYKWNSHRYLTLNPQLGYNFKIKQFFYTAPLRMTYNPKRNGYAELTWANGNRISNDALTEDIQEKMGEDFEVPEYKDESLQLVNNVQAYDWLEILAGLVYHRRSSTNHQTMIDVGMQPVYSSFAPLLTLRFNLWTDGPTLTANYEHSFPNIMSSDLKYDLWEFDLSYKRQMQSLRAINFRVGTGFYTSRNTDYFVDFNNFRDNNLPSSWTDDWTGQFQLLDSKWYNESNYYVRGHVSYESPLLALTWLPWIGRLLETERLYFSALNIEHTRPYFEIGYGFTNRYFSTGLFVSTLNTKFKEFGCRVTIELFRKW